MKCQYIEWNFDEYRYFDIYQVKFNISVRSDHHYWYESYYNMSFVTRLFWSRLYTRRL